MGVTASGARSRLLTRVLSGSLEAAACGEAGVPLPGGAAEVGAGIEGRGVVVVEAAFDVRMLGAGPLDAGTFAGACSSRPVVGVVGVPLTGSADGGVTVLAPFGR